MGIYTTMSTTTTTTKYHCYPCRAFNVTQYHFNTRAHKYTIDGTKAAVKYLAHKIDGADYDSDMFKHTLTKDVTRTPIMDVSTFCAPVATLVSPPTYTCDVCKQVFSTKRGIAQHMRYHKQRITPSLAAFSGWNIGAYKTRTDVIALVDKYLKDNHLRTRGYTDLDQPLRDLFHIDMPRCTVHLLHSRVHTLLESK